MKKILIINGPNLNLLGKREPTIYGNNTFEDYLEQLREKYPQCEISYYQSNIEGELINKIHEVGFTYDGIILNAGAYTHTSIALHDAIKAVTTPVIEVHISNVHAREPFRHVSMISAACKGVVIGFGLESYRLALESFIGK
ncbi:type II 3-dehydroquinate dehydratase [Parabacteroides sp. AD58]|uniref:3-dehydroquinate dehydratase n=1 Tax=Parabacteroides absconsus TaxID=2951805 RepID=A0ABZ2IJA5_9BACT|nr:type II 3-dehydroquinate dehydratase [Parabacteroides sp. AD58]MCM6902662.1 type II 3-dehydroquinate dehydratase [Parabacteroides sp. AD58]HIX22300.1 type II 3-dehydroquinate dehydratase [Candidatus Parabacteroides faecavium]